MLHPATLVAALASAALTVGCATVLDGPSQPIKVDTRSGGVPVSGVRCLLKNNQGDSWLTTPGSAVVRFDRSDLQILCGNALFESPGTFASSQVKPEVLGNLLIGGLVGFGVDHFSGAAYKYPSTIVVDLSPRPDVVLPPSPGVRRAQLSAARAQLATSLDETRSLDLVRGIACEPEGPLILQFDGPSVKHYAVACLDGRTARTVCQPGECRFRTLDD